MVFERAQVASKAEFLGNVPLNGSTANDVRLRNMALIYRLHILQIYFIYRES